MRYSHFEHMIMSYGLANAPATFQSYINYMLSKYLDVFCIAYLDNILIYFYCETDHVTHVSKVLKTILQYQLFGCLNKCKFHVKKIGFVGFIVTLKGLAMDLAKTSCIAHWPKPKQL